MSDISLIIAALQSLKEEAAQARIDNKAAIDGEAFSDGIEYAVEKIEEVLQ